MNAFEKALVESGHAPDEQVISGRRWEWFNG